MLSPTLAAFVIYFLVLFVTTYIVADNAQSYLYNEKTSKLPLRVLVSALIFAGLATWTKPSLDTMFSSQWHMTLLSAVVWMAAFLFIMGFELWHAAAFGIGTMILVLGFAGMAAKGWNTTASEKQTELNQRYTTPKTNNRPGPQPKSATILAPPPKAAPEAPSTAPAPSQPTAKKAQ